MGRPIIVTGVGSRDAPPSALRNIEEVGAFVATLGGRLRSGLSWGADTSFLRGAGENGVVFLPWGNFNCKEEDFTTDVCNLRSLSRIDYPLYKKAIDSVREHHPSQSSLPDSTIFLMARNWLCVNGINGVPSDLLVCWARRENDAEHPEEVVGGTGQAVRIAIRAGIPIVNLAYTNIDDALDKIEDIHDRLMLSGEVVKEEIPPKYRWLRNLKEKKAGLDGLDKRRRIGTNTVHEEDSEERAFCERGS